MTLGLGLSGREVGMETGAEAENNAAAAGEAAAMDEEDDDERTPSLRMEGDEESPLAEDEGPAGEAVSSERNADENAGDGKEDEEAAATPNAVGADEDVEMGVEEGAATQGDGEVKESSALAEDEGPNKKGKAGQKRKSGNGEAVAKKAKKRNTNVWCKSTSRKSGKKGSGKAQAKNLDNDNSVYLHPVMPKVEDGPNLPILLSKIHKAEKVELGADRLSAGSTKGYRMVRATRGVVEGAWYFEITVEHLGKTGHTRLGWCTQKGDVQAPVGYDMHGYAYRDLEGSKVHAAWRDGYGEAYGEGDTIGVYINLPNGAAHAPKPPEIVSFKGMPYTPETKEEPLKPLPESEIAFFKNGICQGPAYKDVYAGRYYPAASMYTLPNEPNCTVRFNFGPDFRFAPSDWGKLTPPQPMSSAPFFSADGQLDPAAAVALQNEAPAITKSMEAEAMHDGVPESNHPALTDAPRPEKRNENSAGKKAKGTKPPKSASKIPKETFGKRTKHCGGPGLQLAVEVPIESDSILSKTTSDPTRAGQEG